MLFNFTNRNICSESLSADEIRVQIKCLIELTNVMLEPMPDYKTRMYRIGCIEQHVIRSKFRVYKVKEGNQPKDKPREEEKNTLKKHQTLQVKNRHRQK